MNRNLLVELDTSVRIIRPPTTLVNPEPVSESMNEYRQGEHICVLYNTPDEQRAVAAEYLADGLARGERCFYVADGPAALNQFNEALEQQGVDVAQALRSNALIEATHADAHLVEGEFDCERMLALLNWGVESALNDGFTGLRTCGDMSWLLLEPPGAGRVVEYEALLNHFFTGVRGSGMCQYDRHRIPAGLLDHALATHSTVVVEGRHRTNPFFEAPAVAAVRTADPDDLDWKLRALRHD